MSMSCEEVRELAAGFLLDALEPAETAAVRKHLRTCPDAHDEFHELGSVVPYLAETIQPVEPPPSLKQRVLAAARADLSARAAQTPPVAHRNRAQDIESAPPRALRRGFRLPSRPMAGTRADRRSAVSWLAAAAAAVLIFALGGVALVLQSDLNAARQYEQGVAAVLDVAAQDGSRVAVLSGADDRARGLAAVGPDGRVAIALRDLRPTAGNEVYEAWIIAGDAAPMPIGDFRVGAGGTGTLVTTTSPPGAELMVAITRERGPGATTPTMPIVASGAAGS